MAVFEYQARDLKHQLVKGTIEAAAINEVARELREKGLIPININPKASEYSLFKQLTFYLGAKTVPREDLITFCRQMHTLIKAGVPMLQILTRQTETMRNSLFVEIIKEAADTIAEGHLLSEAFRKFPTVFEPVFISVLEAGESTGQLEDSFRQLGDYLALEARTIKQVKSAMRYPSMVVVALIVAFTVVNLFVIPAFAQMFSKFGRTLPLPTRILLGTSQFFVEHWQLLLVGFIAIIFAVRMILNTKSGRYVWDSWKLRLPIIGGLVNRIMLARFTRTFSIIMRTGVPLAQGIPLVANAVGNSFIRVRVMKMQESIERGESLTETAEQTHLFSPLVIQMLSVGEQSGSIDTLLEQVAEFYEDEVDYDLKRLADMIEPFLLVLIGVIVLVLALGIFLPMWNMVSLVRGA